MSNRQQRNARKAAARAGDKDQQFFHEPKRPTAPYPTRERKEKARKERVQLAGMLRNPVEALARIQAAAAEQEKEKSDD